MANIKRVSPAEAKQLVDEGYVYLDVRSEPEYAAGPPRGRAQRARSCTPGPRGMAPNPDFLAVVEALYRQGRQARRSAAAPGSARCARPRC